MSHNTEYLFTSQRLGFRNWRNADIAAMSAINADEDVMEFFTQTQSEQQTRDFVARMQQQFAGKGYCCFATHRLDTGEFIGFIGLTYQTYEAPFTPCTDIGWRLAKQAWNNGFATEGALRCLQYGFDVVGLESIKSVAAKVNAKSLRIMEKIGMKPVMDFIHPKLKGDERLQHCVLYEINAPQIKN